MSDADWLSTCSSASARVQTAVALLISDEIDDLLRRSDWIRAYRATAEFFDRRLAALREQQ
jgi:hypothetical protein